MIFLKKMNFITQLSVGIKIKNMIRELIQSLKDYFNAIPNPTEQEQILAMNLNSGYFPITSVHRNDLENAGFDINSITDVDMDLLASKMADDYCEQLFWDSMEIIAGEILCFPRKQ